MRLHSALIPGVLLCSMAFALAACDSAAPFDAASSSAIDARPDHANVNSQLAAARAATARYQRVHLAEQDGWHGEGEPCIYHSELGGMGYHYVNEDLMGPPEMLDVTKPQALLYEPMANGRLQLVGIEYIVPGPEDIEAPSLFGHDFHYNPVLGIWALHVWVWKNNPSGMFKDFNPRVSCEHSSFPVDVAS